MKAPELFGLALRLLGLYLLVDDVPDFVQGVWDLVRGHEAGSNVLWSLVVVGFGVYFLRGARGVQELAYPGQYVPGD